MTIQLEAKRLDIELGIANRLRAGKSVRVGTNTMLDKAEVIDAMYELDPDRYTTAVQTLSCVEGSDVEIAREALQRLWDDAVVCLLQRYAKAIYEQAQREVAG